MNHDHDQRWERSWRRMEAMARKWGRQGGFPNFDNLGGGFRIGRMLASGDLRLVALYLIEQQPRHGYDIIKAVEEKSQGFYSPSPGVVYPALTFLEEAGYTTAEPDGNKKLYTITEEGRAHLNDNREAIQSTLDFLEKAGEQVNRWRDMAREGFAEGGPEGSGPDWGPRRHRRRWRHDRDTPNVVPEFNDARRDLKAAIADAIALGEDEQRRVAELLRQAAADIRRGTAGGEIDL